MEKYPWHHTVPEEVLRILATNSEHGITEEEASRRLAQGTNAVPRPKPPGVLVLVTRQLRSPIAFVLLIAAMITVLISHFTDSLVIAGALLVNVIIGVFQEGRASNAFNVLAKGETVYAVVVRDGKRKEVLADCIVVGDIILLAPGAKVPADARVLESHGLELQESALTGEWVSTEKASAVVSATAPLAERASMLYAGTLVTSGSGRAVVVAIGSETEFGSIAKELANSKHTETPLQGDMRRVSQILLVVVALIIVVVDALALVRGLPLSDVLLISIALAVASIPEGLPAAITVVLRASSTYST